MPRSLLRGNSLVFLVDSVYVRKWLLSYILKPDLPIFRFFRVSPNYKAESSPTIDLGFTLSVIQIFRMYN